MSSTAGAIKSIADFLGRLKQAAIGQEVASQIAQFLPNVTDAYQTAIASDQERAALQKQVAQLEAKVAELEQWQARAEEYELKEVGPGTTAYVPKPVVGSEGPAHLLCANCFHDSKQSILQRTGGVRYGAYVHVCPACKSEILAGSAPPKGPINARGRGPGGGPTGWMGH